MADAGEPERRKALRELLRLLAREAGEIKETVGEARREVVRSLEGALDMPLTEEGRLVRSLYDFTPPPQPSLEELRVLVARSLGVEPGEGGEFDLREAPRRAGSRSADPEPAGDGGREGSRAGEKA